MASETTKGTKDTKGRTGGGRLALLFSVLSVSSVVLLFETLALTASPAAPGEAEPDSVVIDPLQIRQWTGDG